MNKLIHFYMLFKTSFNFPYKSLSIICLSIHFPLISEYRARGDWTNFGHIDYGHVIMDRVNCVD